MDKNTGNEILEAKRTVYEAAIVTLAAKRAVYHTARANAYAYAVITNAKTAAPYVEEASLALDAYEDAYKVANAAKTAAKL